MAILVCRHEYEQGFTAWAVGCSKNKHQLEEEGWAFVWGMDFEGVTLHQQQIIFCIFSHDEAGQFQEKKCLALLQSKYSSW